MKKNKMMRAASALLVAVLLTTCVISGTYAKYTTGYSATTSARVARWGFENTTFTLDDLFAASYSNGTDVSVESHDLAKVIAPGTSGSQKIAFATESGAAPEVDYKFEVSAASSKGDTIKSNPNIVWAFYKEGSTATYGTFDDMLTAINNMSKPKVEAKTLPELSGTYVIAWEWKFENDADSDEVTTDDNALDTTMGNEDTLESIDLSISITATQID